MFSEKKFHEILEKSWEKVWYKAQADIKEEEEEPVFNSTEWSQEEDTSLIIKDVT